MELPRTSEGRVTRLAVARAIRGVSCAELARLVGARAVDIYEWEHGEPVPGRAMMLRLALALGWPWEDMASPPLEPDQAWNRLVSARRKAVALG